MPRAEAIDQLQQRARSQDAAGLLILSPINVRYLTGFYSSAYSRPLGLLVPAEGTPVLLIPHLEAEQARQMTEGIEVRDYVEWASGSRAGGALLAEWQALLLEVLGERGLAGPRLGVEWSALNVERDQALRAALPGPAPIDVSGWVEALRLRKTADEIENHKRAATIAAAGLDACFDAARQGLTELEIFGAGSLAAHTEAARRYPDRPIEIGGKALVGTRLGAIHSPSIGVPLRPGDPVFAVMVVAVGGSWCELSRTFVIGAAATDEQERIQQAVEDAHNAALALAVPGRPAHELDTAARESLATRQLDRFLPMRTGHGVGHAPVEAPNLGASDPTMLQAGMIVSIEPGVCIPGVGGSLWADNYLITDQGAERLTTYPLRET
jgi:Xaa-Pro dipeptidase